MSEGFAPSHYLTSTSAPKFCSECGCKFALSAECAPKFCSECGQRVPWTSAFPHSPQASESRPVPAYSNLDALLQATAAAKATIVLSPGSSDQSDQSVNVTIMGNSPTLMGAPRTDFYKQTLMGTPRSDVYVPTLMGAPRTELYSPAPLHASTYATYSAYSRARANRGLPLGSIVFVLLILVGITLSGFFLLLNMGVF